MIQRIVKAPKAKSLKNIEINTAQNLYKENIGKISQSSKTWDYILWNIYIFYTVLQGQARLQSQKDVFIVRLFNEPYCNH